MTLATQYLFQEELYAIPPPDVTVVLSKNWETYLPEDKALLSKILGSVKLSLASVHMLSYAELSTATLTHLKTSKVLVFGSSVPGMTRYEFIQAQGFSMIAADDLPELDESKKKSLWVALKGMFGA